MAHPAVRAAVDILGGELHDVKTRPRAVGVRPERTSP